MSPLVIAVFVSAALSGAGSFTVAWRHQAAKITQIQLDQNNERINLQRAARATIERTTSAVITAQNNAANRGVVIRRNVDGSRAELDGLRQSTEAAMRSASANLDACTVAAATAHQLLNQCGGEYQALAERADRHASDIETLTEAWPR